MSKTYSIKLEIYKSLPLPTEPNQVPGNPPRVEDCVTDADGELVSYENWILTMKLTTGETAIIKNVRRKPSPGEILKVHILQTGQCEVLNEE